MQNDDRTDALVRAASAYPVDEDNLAQGVLARLRQHDAGIFGLFGTRTRGAALAFACLLAATPVVVSQVPTDAEDAIIASFLMGEGVLDDATFDALLGGEALQ